SGTGSYVQNHVARPYGALERTLIGSIPRYIGKHRQMPILNLPKHGVLGLHVFFVRRMVRHDLQGAGKAACGTHVPAKPQENVAERRMEIRILWPQPYGVQHFCPRGLKLLRTEIGITQQSVQLRMSRGVLHSSLQRFGGTLKLAPIQELLSLLDECLCRWPSAPLSDLGVTRRCIHYHCPVRHIRETL